MRIVWDEPKRRTTLARRGLDFADLDADLFEEATVTPTRGGRFSATGRFQGAMLP